MRVTVPVSYQGEDFSADFCCWCCSFMFVLCGSIYNIQLPIVGMEEDVDATWFTRGLSYAEDWWILCCCCVGTFFIGTRRRTNSLFFSVWYSSAWVGVLARHGSGWLYFPPCIVSSLVVAAEPRQSVYRADDDYKNKRSNSRDFPNWEIIIRGILL